MTMAFVLLIWVVKIVEFTFNLDLSEYGILPRTLNGSIGIITGPLIHGDIFHLLSNTFPVLILGMGILYFYHRIAPAVLIMIYLMTGFWVWIAARDAYHIGASGLVYGMLTFLLLSGFIRRDMVPERSHISWESHLMGAIAGIFCAVYFKNYKLAHTLAAADPEEEPDQVTYHYTYTPKKETDGEPPKTYINVVDLDEPD